MTNVIEIPEALDDAIRAFMQEHGLAQVAFRMFDDLSIEADSITASTQKE